MGQVDARDDEVKLIMKHALEWVRTSDPVISSTIRYLWTTAPAVCSVWEDTLGPCVVSGRILWGRV